METGRHQTDREPAETSALTPLLCLTPPSHPLLPSAHGMNFKLLGWRPRPLPIPSAWEGSTPVTGTLPYIKSPFILYMVPGVVCLPTST